jgi:hypothetical protein
MSVLNSTLDVLAGACRQDNIAGAAIELTDEQLAEQNAITG